MVLMNLLPPGLPHLSRGQLVRQRRDLVPQRQPGEQSRLFAAEFGHCIAPVADGRGRRYTEDRAYFDAGTAERSESDDFDFARCELLGHGLSGGVGCMESVPCGAAPKNEDGTRNCEERMVGRCELFRHQLLWL